MKIIISVRGGIVQDVLADGPCDVEVFDFDEPSYATKAEEKEFKAQDERYTEVVSELELVY